MSVSKKLEKKIEKRKQPVVTQSSSDNDYMKGVPNRIEVANYVASVMENFYLPLISNQVQLSTMILQAVLLEKDICSGEDIKRITKSFTQEHLYREQVLKNKNSITKFLESQSNLKRDSAEGSLDYRLSAIYKCLNEQTYELSDKHRLAIQSITQKAHDTLSDAGDLKELVKNALKLRTELEQDGILFDVSDKQDDINALFGSAVLHVLTELIMSYSSQSLVFSESNS